MIKNLLIIALTFLTNFLFGQGCEVKKDPFSNSKVVSYHFGHYIVFEANGDEILLKYYFPFGGELNTIMAKGSIISFKFENGEMIELSATENINPITQVQTGNYGTVITTEYIAIMKVSVEHLKTFANSKMTHVRYPDLKGGYLTFDRSKRWVNHFMEGAKCIQDNINK